MTDSQPDAAALHAFVELAESLQSDHDVVDTMDVLVQIVVRHTGADQSAVVLADESGALRVAASSNERSEEVEEAQIGRDEGPCLECYRTGELVEVEDIAATRDRWPTFAATAEKGGLRAALGVPFRIRDRVVGGMNVFLDQPGRLSDANIAFIQALTQVAAISVVQERAENAEISQLQSALRSRVVIEQAKGFLAFQHDTTVDQAFGTIRTFARSNQRRLSDVARAVVERRLVL